MSHEKTLYLRVNYNQIRDSRMSEKKVVGRGVAVGLGIICILLAVGLVGVFAYYSMTLNNKNSAYDDYVSSHSHSNSDYNSLNSQKTNLQNQVNDLNDILNMAKSATWANSETVNQPAGGYYAWGRSPVDYAGYLSVWVQTSTTTNTYVRVIWSSHGIYYDQQIGVGSSGTAVFPVLPASSIEIRVGNSNWINGATETVTITYHY
jgi:hypothetical protein